MTYAQLIEQFQNALQFAITDYERLHPKIPTTRAEDIIWLKAQWTSNNARFIRKQTVTRFHSPQFKTGLFGRSELRSKVMRIIDNPQFSIDAFNVALEEENKLLRTQLHAASNQVLPIGSESELRSTVQALLQENEKLKKDNSALFQENDVLKKTIEKLTSSNDVLGRLVHNLNERLVIVEESQLSIKKFSPSDEVTSAFRDLAGRSSFLEK